MGVLLNELAGLDAGFEAGCPACSPSAALCELTALLTSAGQEPRVRVAELSGDRWAGKTRLLQDVAAVAARAGWQVAPGSGLPSLPGMPFGLFIDALDDLACRIAEDLETDLSPEQVRRLGRIFPALATGPPRPRLADDRELYSAFVAIRDLIEALCATENLLLLLDDLQWADEASVKLLGHLLRYPPKGRMLLVFAHRSKQGDQTLRGLMNAAAAAGAARRIALAPLADQDALALLPDDVSTAGCRAFLEASGGNPGLLRALVSLRVRPGEPAGVPPRLPPGVLAACLRDFNKLSGSAWLVAKSVAVIEEPFEPAGVGQVAQIGDTELRAAIDELTSQDLIRSGKSPTRLHFVNPLLRAAAYQSAGPGWLLGAHARAAQVLASRGRPASEIARHAEYIATTGDVCTGEVLLRAAGERVWTDPGQAVSWIRTIEYLQLASGATSPGRRLLLGQALATAGRLAQAEEVLTATAELVTPGNQVWAEAVRWRAWVRYLDGRSEQAWRDLDAVLRALPADAAEAQAGARLTRLVLAIEAGPLLADGRGAVAGEDAAALRRLLPRIPALLAGQAAAVLAAAGRTQSADQARQYATSAASAFDRASDDEAAPYLEGLYWLAQAEIGLGCPGAADEHCERGLRLAEQRRLGGLVPMFATMLGTLQLGRGELDGARRNAVCAKTAARLTGSARLAGLATTLEVAISQHDSLAGRLPDQCPEPDQADRPGMTMATWPDCSGEAQTELCKLSGRELEIAVLVSHGRTNQQIARSLGLSHKTVETYLARIFKKLVVSCRAEVAAMIGRSGQLRMSGPSLTAPRADGLGAS